MRQLGKRARGPEEQRKEFFVAYRCTVCVCAHGCVCLQRWRLEAHSISEKLDKVMKEARSDTAYEFPAISIVKMPLFLTSSETKSQNHQMKLFHLKCYYLGDQHLSY